MQKGTAYAGMLLSFLGGLFLMYGINKSQDSAKVGPEMAQVAEDASPSDHSASPIAISKEDPQWGDEDALVTIVEISDFQCPFCSKVLPTIDKIKKTYGPKKVRVVWKQNPLPFHKQAGPAHEASVAVKELGGNDAFWKFHDLAFKNQRALNEDNFVKWAAESGVDEAKFKAAWGDAAKKKKYAAKVQKDLADNRKIGATGTPAFRINGVTLSGAQPFDKFKSVIDAQISKAEALVKKGTPKNEVSLKLTKENFKKAPPAKKRQKAKEDTTVWRVPVLKDDPSKGPADALVTIVEWSDFQCPFCSRVNPTIAKLLKEYPKDVRVVWKDNALPFHKEAKPAATLARMAFAKGGSPLFWKAHDLLFENQKALNTETYKQLAGKLGLSAPAVLNAIKKEQFDDKISASMELASDLKARGTPHFFVNGRRLSGAQPFERFKTLVDDRLKIAQAKVKAGVPRTKVYDELMKGAKGPPKPEKRDVAAPGKNNPFKGAANAKIVIQEFSDFECPFCSRVNPTIKKIMEEYAGQVKVVWRSMPLPFHKNAKLASEAAHEAFVQQGNSAFWKYHDLLFKNQRALQRDSLEKYAEEVGLDMAKFKKALDDRTHQKQVEADMAVAKKAGVSGTPAFTVNGYFLSGAQPFGQFQKLIKLALKK